MPNKRKNAVKFLSGLLKEGVPVHAVGMQGHWQIDRVPMQDVEDTIIALKNLGLKVLVAELDIDMVPRDRWWADGGKYREEMAAINPYPETCPPELLKRQAEQYRELFDIFLRHQDAIQRITFWNLHDGTSWLNTFPWDRTNYPLLFDRNAKPKPAYGAVISAASKK